MKHSPNTADLLSLWANASEEDPHQSASLHTYAAAAHILQGTPSHDDLQHALQKNPHNDTTRTLATTYLESNPDSDLTALLPNDDQTHLDAVAKRLQPLTDAPIPSLLLSRDPRTLATRLSNTLNTPNLHLPTHLHTALLRLCAKLHEDFADPNDALALIQDALTTNPDDPALQSVAMRLQRRLNDRAGLLQTATQHAISRTSPTATLAATVDLASLLMGETEPSPERVQTTLSLLRRHTLERPTNDPTTLLFAEWTGLFALHVQAWNDALDAFRLLLSHLPEDNPRYPDILTLFTHTLAQLSSPHPDDVENATRRLQTALQYNPSQTLLWTAWESLSQTDPTLDLQRRTTHGDLLKRYDILLDTIEDQHLPLTPQQRLELWKRALSYTPPPALFGPRSPFETLQTLLQNHPSQTLHAAQHILNILPFIEHPHDQLHTLQTLLALPLTPELHDTFLEALDLHLALSPNDLSIFTRLRATAAHAQDWTFALSITTLQAKTLQEHNHPHTVDALCEQARILAYPLQRPQDALEPLQNALSLNPSHPPTRALLELLAFSSQDPHDMARILSLQPPPRGRSQAQHTSLLALYTALVLNDHDTACTLYLNALEHDPQHLPALLGLLEFGRPQTDCTHRALTGLRTLEFSSPTQSTLALIHAHLLDSLDAPQEALTALREAFHHTPNEATLYALLRALLRLGSNDEALELFHTHAPLRSDSFPIADLDLAHGVSVDIPPEHAPWLHLFDALQTGDLDTVAQRAQSLLDSQNPLLSDPFRQTLSDLCADAALAHFTQPVDPSLHHPHSDTARFAHALRSHDLNALLQLHTSLSERAPTHLERAFSRHAQARISHHLLPDTDEAQDLYSAVLESFPHHLPAIKALRLQQEMTGDRAGLARTFALEGQRAYSDDYAVELLFKAAQLQRKHLGDLDAAVHNLRAVLTREPSHDEAFEGLRELYTMRQNWDDLYTLYNHRIHVIDDPASRKELALFQAEIAFNHLNDLDRAVACHEHVLEIDPSYIQSYRILAELHEARGAWTQAIEALRGIVTRTTNKTLLARMYRSIASLFEDKLEDLPQAIDAYRALLQHVPTDLAAQRSTAELLGQLGRWEDAAQAYTELLNHERNPNQKCRDLIALAEIAEHGLQQPQRADQCYQALLHLAPENLDIVRVACAHFRNRNRLDAIQDHTSSLAKQLVARITQAVQNDTPKDVAHGLSDLFDLSLEIRDTDRAFRTARVAKILSIDLPKLLTWGDRAREHLPTWPQNSIPSAQTAAILPPNLAPYTLQFLRLTDPIIQRVFPTPDREYGLGRKTRVSSRDSRIEAQRLVQLPGLLSVVDLTGHILPESSALRRPLVLIGQPPQLVVPANQAAGLAQSNPSALFETAQAIAPLSMGIAGWHSLPEDLFIAAFTTLARSLQPSWDPTSFADHRRLNPKGLLKHMHSLGKDAQTCGQNALTELTSSRQLLEQRTLYEVSLSRLALVLVPDPLSVLRSLRAMASRSLVLDTTLFLLHPSLSSLRAQIGVAQTHVPQPTKDT